MHPIWHIISFIVIVQVSYGKKEAKTVLRRLNVLLSEVKEHIMKTVFEMIRDGEIPSVKLYEDDVCFVILDINPISKGHSLVISKEVYPCFTDAPLSTLGHMM